MIGMLAAWALVIGALTWFLADSQSKGRASLAQRLDARAQLGAEFISLYVGDVLAHERSDALSWLQAPHVSERRFESTTAGLGLGAAVLLDGRGRLLAVVPAKPSLLGHVMTGKYAHLAAAVAGHTAVSDVVAS
ncbi:MAG: hypothetical protein JO206_15650, partial [Solirubrobacterales bacterium]|nr:hypothetical protein [Solirubrobacterales bacterium]